MPKQYLGDGVYAEFEAATLNVILTAEDGERATNRIVLEPEVLDALGRYVKRTIYDRHAVDSRAHAGDGQGAALEAGAGDARRELEDAAASDEPEDRS